MDPSRPSSFAAGLSLGLAVASAMLYRDAERSDYHPLLYACAVVFCAGAIPFLEAVGYALAWLLAEVRKARKAPPQAQPPASVVPVAPPVDETATAMRTALVRFFRAGELAEGFSIRKLDGVVGSDTWARLVTHFASEAGGRILIDKGGNVGYQFNHGQTLDGVLLALELGRLPCPPGPVPDVQPYVAHTRNATRQAKHSATVIDGSARKVEA